MKKEKTLERLKFAEFKLKALLELTNAINDNLPSNLLIDNYKNIIVNELQIGKLLLYSKSNGNWNLLTSHGINQSQYLNIDINSLINFKDISYIEKKNIPFLEPFDIIIPVYHKNELIAFLLLGDIYEEKQGISPIIKHFNFIQTLTNILIVAIENKVLNEKLIYQQKIKHELELAQKIQMNLIPETKDFSDNFLKIYSFYQPHYEVGGDYYDFFYLTKNDLAFCIADASGKGISAALIMSNFQATLRALFTNTLSLNKLTHKLNKIIYNNTKGENFITAFIAKYNVKSRTLTYVNSAHVPPILCLNNKTIKLLYPTSPGIGMLENLKNIKTKKIKIPKNSSLLCFTDGFMEYNFINNSICSEFLKKIESLLISTEKKENIIQNLLNELNNFKKKENETILDDITILLLNFL